MALYSTWLTPEGLPKRFHAWFYLAVWPEQRVVIDEGEIVASQWLSPAKALEDEQAGRIQLPPPTFVTLSALKGFTRSEEAIASLSAQVRHLKPRIVSMAEGFASLYEEDAGYSTCDLNVPGARHRLLKSERGYDYQQSALLSDPRT